MGKRKSKTSKQKQAKAAAKSLKARSIQSVVSKEPQQRGVSTAPLKGKGSSFKKSKKSAAETRDFQRQQASLEERQLAQQQSNQKKRRNNQKTKDNFFTFQAPTLIVDDAQKSTTQLVQETARKVQRWDGMKDEQEDATSNNKKISLKQVFHTSQLYQSVLQTVPPPQKNQRHQQSTNRFAMLDDSGDDDGNRKQPAVPLFQFAPPSFAVATTNDDLDPDL